MRRSEYSTPPASQGARESNQTCGGTILMWHWTIQSVPILANFSLFLLSSNPCGATMKPRRSQSSFSKCHSFFKRNTGNFTEVEQEHSASRSGSVEKSYFSGSANYTIFGALGEYPIQVCESSSMSGKNFLSTLDTSDFTACGNVDPTLREEPLKTMTFYENLGRSCNIDHPE